MRLVSAHTDGTPEYRERFFLTYCCRNCDAGHCFMCDVGPSLLRIKHLYAESGI